MRESRIIYSEQDSSNITNDYLVHSIITQHFVIIQQLSANR